MFRKHPLSPSLCDTASFVVSRGSFAQPGILIGGFAFLDPSNVMRAGYQGRVLLVITLRRWVRRGRPIPWNYYPSGEGSASSRSLRALSYFHIRRGKSLVQLFGNATPAALNHALFLSRVEWSSRGIFVSVSGWVIRRLFSRIIFIIELRHATRFINFVSIPFVSKCTDRRNLF